MEKKKVTNKTNNNVKKKVLKKKNTNKKKPKKGFTLIELLAVIVILGLLMAIAIPSVTKYITQSRVKTLVSTVDSYVRSVSNQVNDGDYKFSDGTKIYAIPIECVSLEKGGTNPFGEWMQANDNYWAYVLVQYDSENYNYKYGFTFKDSAGYGMYPTVSEKISEKKDQVRTGYDDLTKPNSDKAIEFVSSDKWDGFEITSDTELVVLESESEGNVGNGETTCTLCQKGDNYEELELEKKMRLSNLIKEHNTIIKAKPTFHNVLNDMKGLYVSIDTNSAQPTYYFRGNVTNNYVEFARQKWRIVRINENGTIRVISTIPINYKEYIFNTKFNNYKYMYYSNSDTAKPTVDSWYQTNIIDKGYDLYIAEEMFCEQAKAKQLSEHHGGKVKMILMSNYIPDFKCKTDANGKGVIDGKVGLITIDEVLHAGNMSGNNYLYNSRGSAYTMSPAGFGPPYARAWHYNSNTAVGSVHSVDTYLYPVINFNANVTATGTGTSSDPYVVKTN